MVSCYDNNFNCLQSSIAYICNVNGVDARVLFVLFYGINIGRKPECPFRNRLMVGMRASFREIFENYFGWNITIYEEKNIDIELIEQEKNAGNYILAEIDAYGCKWNPAYRIAHGNHYCIIRNIDSPNRKLEFLDPYYGEMKREMFFDEYEKCKKRIFVIHVVLRSKDICVRNIIKKSLVEYQKENIEMYRILLNQLPKSKWEDFFESNQTENCKLIIAVKQIGDNYSGFLKYVISKEYGKDFGYDTVYKIINQWNLFRKLLIKCHIIKKVTHENIRTLLELINEIAYLDSLILCKLKKSSREK